MTGSPGRWTRSPRSWTRSPAAVGAAAITRVRRGCVPAALGHDLDLAVRRLPGGRIEEYPAPRWGHPKDRRPDLKQIQTGLAVSGDGGIPVFHRAYDGGAAEVAQVAGAMTALKQIAGPRPFLLVGDSKLISYTNAAAMGAQGVGFVAPLAALAGPGRVVRRAAAGAGTAGGLRRRAGRGQARRRAGHLPGAGRRRDGPARAPQDRPAGAPAPDPGVLLGERRRPGQGPGAEAGQGRRGTGPAGAHRRDPVPPHRGRRGRPRPRRSPPSAASGAYLRTAITAGAAGKPVLSWHFDQAAIDAEAAADGWYALLTNLDPGQAGPAEVFRRYKGQHVVERRYGEFKGPLAVAPLFLKTNRRITALITVICLALLIFCLVERQVRNALAPHGEMMTGLPGYGPTPARPTGRTIFQALADLRLIPAHDGNPATIPKPAGVQARLLDLLDIDISRPRWLTT